MIEYVDRNVQRLIHMIEGIKRINRSLAGVSQNEHPEIPWGKMRGMRNRLAHIFDYEQIDYEIVWDVAKNALPELEPKIRAALMTIPLPDDFTLPEV